MDLNVIVLAAGRGERMASQLPKVLHPVAGQPMLARSLRTITEIYPKQVRVVVGPASHVVSSVAGKFKALCFQQSEKAWGTAQAVLAARPEEMKGDVLIINGDHPLISSADLIQFIRSYHKLAADCAVASFKNPHPSDFGRLLFKGDQLVDIVEAYEVDKTKKQSQFVNAGLYLVKANLLQEHLKEVTKNVKEEYNLTDLISILHKEDCKVRAIDVPWNVAFGVNNQRELAIATSIAFENNCYKHMDNGVVIMDFKNTYIEGDVVIGKGSLIYPGVYLRGKTKIGSFCAIESNTYIFDSLIRNYVNVKAGSYIEGAIVGEKSVIGPYAHLRPETVVGSQCRIGNFVETKKVNIGDNSKAAHLTYLGDADIGNHVNIGCGTVICNYGVDGKKRKTKIGDKAFIGSGSQLIAPLEVGDEAVVGAGSVITKNIPKGNLAVERTDQKNIKDYNSKSKKSKKVKFMCGIFAYSGPRNVAEVLIKGLKNLEYRGYDSTGVAFFNNDQIHRFRVRGGVDELEKKIQTAAYEGSLGIGHTRWATHGVPSEKNAHPHHSHCIYVVHNGIIENEDEIKKIIDPSLLLSDTDTEVIPHLIYHFYKNPNLNFLQSILESIKWFKGSYAVVAVNEKQPNEMVAFKSGPPLILCKGENEFFISSDLHAIGQQADQMIILEDGEVLFLKKNEFQIFNFQGEKVFREFKKCSQEKMESKKGHHPHFMLKEILEQPQSITRLIDNHIDKNKQEIVLKLSKGNEKEFSSLLKDSSELMILACGSSYHAALFAKYFLEDMGKIKVSVEIASEFIYRKAFVPKNTFILFISQSGETADILTAFKQIEQLGLKSFSLCNVRDSSLDRKTDFVLSMLAGPEVAVASTKTFSSSLMALSFLAFHLAKIKGLMDVKQEQDFVKSILNIPLLYGKGDSL